MKLICKDHKGCTVTEGCDHAIPHEHRDCTIIKGSYEGEDDCPRCIMCPQGGVDNCKPFCGCVNTKVFEHRQAAELANKRLKEEVCLKSC